MMEMIGMMETFDVVGFWSLDLRLESVNRSHMFFVQGFVYGKCSTKTFQRVKFKGGVLEHDFVMKQEPSA